MSIIEKLGMKTLGVYSTQDMDGRGKFNYREARELEQQRNDFIEATVCYIKAYQGAMEDNHWSEDIGDIVKSMIEIYLLDALQQATGIKWEEIEGKL